MTHYYKLFANAFRYSRSIFSLLMFNLYLCTATFGQTTLRLYLVGNSITDAINYEGLKQIAESQGNTHIWGRHMIPGAPLDWLWNNQNSGFTESPYGPPNNAFPNYTWDAISLQPFDRQIEGGDKEAIDNYINLAKGKSPNVQFYIYMRWPRTPNNLAHTDPSLTADTWTNLWQRTYTGSWDGTNETKDYFEKLLLAVRGFSSINRPILIVPVGEVFNNLNTKMKNGQVPGYNRIWQVYSDGIHMNSVGSYIVALTFYATIYKRDPRGTNVPSQYGSIPGSVATAIQNSVWEVVSTYQYSGVTTTNVPVTGVTVSPTTVTLSNGQTSQLTATVTPSNATNKTVTWSTSNALIASVNSSGLVTANGAGTATITATTADGGKTASATITVNSAGGGGATTGILAAWDFAGKGGQNNLPATSKMTQVSSATAFIASGLIPLDYLGNGLTARNANATSLAAAISGNKYFSFTINPASGQNYTVEKIELFPVSQGVTRTFSLMSSKNGFSASNVITTYTAFAEFNGSKITLNVTGHANMTSSTEFRVYVHSSSDNIWESVGFGNAAGDDFVVIGSVGGGADTQAPTAPTNLAASNVKATTLSLSWTNSTDNVGVTGYDIFRGSTKLNSSLITTNTFNVTGLSACTDYSFTVRAYDAAGNNSTSSALSVKTNCAPTAVLNATPTTGSAPLAVSFNANGSSDPDAGDFILGYEWDFGDGSAISNANAPSHTYKTAGTFVAKLRVMDNRDLYSTQVTRTITVGSESSLRNPDNPSNTTAGLEYQYYEGDWNVLPNFSALTSVKSGNVNNFDLSVRNRNDLFGMRFTGFISIPSDGNYTFFTTSDDGSKLFIGNQEVVNNDGLHPMEERSGTIGLKAGLHAITVIFFEKTGGEGLEVRYSSSSISKQLVPASALFRASSQPVGSVVMETWTNISGVSTSQIPNTAPNSTSTLTKLEIPIDVADNYGTRIRGYIIPSSTGSYTFYVSGDDNVDFFLSTDDNPANRSKIAYVDGWTTSREWNKYSSQKSAAISLQAGQRYFFEALHKEGGGGDNMAIGWTGPGISSITVIGGSNIAPFEGTIPSQSDTQAPTVPTGLSASNVSQTSFTLSWNASTDNVGVSNYEVFRDGTSLGSVNSTSMNISGLTAGTTYSMTVRARDAAGNVSAASSPLSVTTSSNSSTNPPSGLPQLPIGMNVNGLTYYSSGIIFTDAMSTASDMFTFYDGGPWNSEQIQNIPRDVNGYPTQVPYTAGGQQQYVRFLVNNYYTGRYIVLYDGVGTLRINGIANGVTGGRQYIDFNGQGGHVWIDILSSQQGNHIRNMRILPEQYANGGTYPTFLPKFLDGLRPFHALRFMDWTSTNDSKIMHWNDRPTKTYYSQATQKGQCMEYAIELANTLNQHAWFCIPHLASDDYIRNTARLLRDNLKPNLKVYIEYSNEIWNWQFSQATYVLNNAPNHPNSYVSQDLARISPNSDMHPEKDAYMMARVFRIFREEFTGANRNRLVCVAAVQQEWYDNTRRVLEYLKNANQQCDVVSPAGYFSFEEADHNRWVSRCSGVTAEEVVDAGIACFDRTSGEATLKTGDYAKQYGVGYVVYEGGQHMQPFRQQDWCYNDAVWDAQIHPKMYDLYMKNFRTHVDSRVNCSLFMAFSYVGERKSRYGSWGHLESLDQVGRSDLRTVAPKYQALLDANAPKSGGRKEYNGSVAEAVASEQLAVFPNPFTDGLNIRVRANESTQAVVRITDLMGHVIFETTGEVTEGNNQMQIAGQNLASGVYLVSVQMGNTRLMKKIMKN